MKNLIKLSLVLVVMAFVSIPTMAQSSIVDKMYKHFNLMDDVTYLSFSKSLLGMMNFDCVDDEDDNISGDLDELKVVIYKPESEPNASFKSLVYEYIEKGNYKLVEENDSDDDTEVWVKKKGRRISECHVIFQGEQNGVLLSFLGDFKIDDLDKITTKVDDYK
ncbi:DUF4252 domain-containing protein [Saccharicrinis aurantiacus]|uniref:DUF4252 domain-containing protein n=1 Tax=Saccharicrinis aurantiacus TaxID=1849719 RepID=UPI000838F481|nr:DUF4252 domain-containing protein [Saccharicrinis aurantiacus]